MGVDPAIAEEAMILTAIGMGTAFIVLVLLLVVVSLIGVFNRYVSDDATDSDSKPEEEDAEARDRALAAALAVTALRASRPRTSLTTGEDA